ncbi:MAG: L,D-transpeptidase [Terrimicrobiaceae bacterium]
MPHPSHDGLPPPIALRVEVKTQRMHLLLGGEVDRTFEISTSRFGLGSEEGSFKTPTGHFLISEKIGDGAPSGAIFRSRQPTGELAMPGGEEDLVLTRILWLSGVDRYNANTHSRYIYIHGTNQEHLIGQPASHGCIRMRNEEIIILYDLVPLGTPIEILET